MKFHVIAAVMLLTTGFLVYFLLFGFHTDLENARTQIRKESVQNLKEDKRVQSNDRLAPYINRVLVETASPPPLEQKAEAPSSSEDEAPPSEKKMGEKNYWCRNVSVRIETSPVKCVYPDACYGCDGPIIPPEYEDAIPMCANGSQSQLYHVECCPSLTRGVLECPSNDQCFKAEDVPADFCSCNNQPDCRLVQIGSQVQCVCIQN